MAANTVWRVIYQFISSTTKKAAWDGQQVAYVIAADNKQLIRPPEFVRDGRTVPSPEVTHIMAHMLKLKPEDKLLEIGTGSASQTAEWAKSGCEVHTIELKPVVEPWQVFKGEDQVYAHIGDGKHGLPNEAMSEATETHANEDTANSPKTGPTEKQLAARFKPGQSGNPSGRPKKKWLTEAVEEMLEEKLSDPKERKRWQDAQWEKMLKHGVVGAMFMDKAWERTEGKVPQDFNLGGEVHLNLADAIALARKRAKDE